jgi:hypothetical protein
VDVPIQQATRDALVAELRRRLTADSYPRLTMLLVLSVAGGCAFLFSAISVRAGLVSMPVRYAVASVIGYAAFLGGLRAWIGWERRRFVATAGGPSASLAEQPPNRRRGKGVDLDWVPGVDLSGKGGAVEAPGLFSGGTSGGGGASEAWVPMPVVSDTGQSESAVSGVAKAGVDAASSVFDSDDLWWLIVALVAVFGALIAVVYVVYLAPVLLAEVAFDGAVVSTTYQRLRNQDLRSWEGDVLRRTWLPAIVVIVMMTLVGYALHRVAPEAHSIGAVVRGLMGR